MTNPVFLREMDRIKKPRRRLAEEGKTKTDIGICVRVYTRTDREREAAE